jgi:iron complex outermembrane receptor protein|tara:strand:+ start:167 stop:3133 length:2967 start_codon:yes stop_codon:yes gene_type:complete
MQFKIPHDKNLLCTAVALSLLPLSGTSLAQDDQIEEVVVTGSFIRKSEGFTQASSVVQLTAEDLEAQGTLNMGEVIQNLAFVNGSASAITNTIQGQDSRSSSIDLRGLGASSTLTLLDGKRLVNQNVNALLPSIAIQRLDIVADGAAALYGSEAVAGVVNFVPYKTYDGLKLETFAEGDSRGDWDHHSIQALWGGDVGVLDVVLAGQFRSQTRLGWDERSDLANSGLVFSSNAPGNYFVPGRDANGAYTGDKAARQPDPNCAPAADRTDYTPGVANNPLGMNLGGTCYFDFGDTRSYFEPEQDTKLFGNATWDYSDDLTLSFQGVHTRLYETRYESTSNPGNSRIAELPTVRGEIPGNPFRAVDAGGNVLFGVDANGDGVPDRQSGVDINNDGLDDSFVSGIANNGVPLFEDVRARTLRPINKTHRASGGHSRDMDNVADGIDHLSRLSFQADFNVPFLEDWKGMAAYTYNYRELKFMSSQNYDITAMQQGLNCDVVNDRDSCYNPFFVVDQANQVSVQVMDAIAARDKEIIEDKLSTIDLVLNGTISPGGFELPGGPIAAAVGYQLRDEKYTNTPSAVELAGDTWIGSADKESITSGSREVNSYFMEVSLPILSNLEASLAVRHEDFSTDQKSTDPKFGVTYAPTDWLTLRATKGEAFIAPSLQDLLNPTTCGLSTVTDRFGPFSAFTTACGGGNPGLTNETSESQQFGFDLSFNNFDLAFTWNNTDFQNRIININGQDKMELDFSNFVDATGFAGTGLGGSQPSEDQLRAWVANPSSDQDIIRDPNDIYTILQVNNTSTINAETVEVTAYDINATYRFSFDNIGDFRVNLQATYIDEFLYQSDPSEPVRDGAGEYNDRTSAAPELPSIKANLQLGWSRDGHSITSIVRYIDAIENYDGPLFTHMDYFGGVNRPGNIRETGVKAWTDMDMVYTYRGMQLFGGEMAFSLGARNVFDRQAQNSPEFAGIIGGLQDPRGRILYGRLVFDL